MTIREFIVQLLREDLDSEITIQVTDDTKDTGDTEYPMVDGIALPHKDRSPNEVAIVPSRKLQIRKTF